MTLPGWAAAWRHDPQWSSLRPLGKEDLPLLFAGTEHRAWIAEIENYLVDGTVPQDGLTCN